MDHIEFDSGIIGDIGSKMPCAHRVDTQDSGATGYIEPESAMGSLAGHGFASALMGAGVVIYDDLRFQADNAGGYISASDANAPESGLTGSKMPVAHGENTSPARTVMERLSMARAYADMGKTHDSLELLADAIECWVMSAEECQ